MWNELECYSHLAKTSDPLDEYETDEKPGEEEAQHNLPLQGPVVLHIAAFISPRLLVLHIAAFISPAYSSVY